MIKMITKIIMCKMIIIKIINLLKEWVMKDRLLFKSILNHHFL